VVVGAAPTAEATFWDVALVHHMLASGLTLGEASQAAFNEVFRVIPMAQSSQ
jgi:hypothetical protein